MEILLEVVLIIIGVPFAAVVGIIITEYLGKKGVFK